MKVLLLGATGRTGRLLLQRLLNERYTVHALVRDKNKLRHVSKSLQLFEGSPIHVKNILEAATGCEAIISVLNISRVSDFPWAKLRTPKDLLSNTMKNILQVCSELNIRRAIICSAWGVHETKKDIPYWFRWIIDNSNVGVAYHDHERQEELLKNSTLDYTIVRPAGLTNSMKEKETRVTQDNIPRPSWMISRNDVAKFMVGQLRDGSYSRKAVSISNN